MRRPAGEKERTIDAEDLPDVAPAEAEGPPPKPLKLDRMLNIGMRTVHIGVTGVLVGGYVFDIPQQTLEFWFYATLASGVILIAIEAYPRWWWFVQGRGVAVLVKTGLLSLIPWLWDYRLVIVAVVIVIASVGSHMPARFRYYSFVHRRVL